MNVRRETPSILELCQRHNKRKDQEVASNIKNSLVSRRDPAVRGLCSGQSCPNEAYESNVSPEMRQKFFPYVGLNRNELRFSTNSFPPTVVSEQPQGRQGYVQNEAVNLTQACSHSQANRQCGPHYHHDPFSHHSIRNGLEYPLRLRTKDPLHYSRHFQDLENIERRQTYNGTSSLYEYMQRNEANSLQGNHNESNERETKLPPIQRFNDRPRTRGAEPLAHQFRVGKQRRQGRREECEANNQRCERRKGVCPVTDTAREQRTFVRVLSKRF